MGQGIGASRRAIIAVILGGCSLTLAACGGGGHKAAAGSSGGGSGASNTTDTAASSAPSNAGGTVTTSTFCDDVWNITNNLMSLNTNAIGGGVGGTQTPSLSDWQKADADIHKLVSEAPTTVMGSTTVREDTTTAAGDVDDIISNGFGDSNGSANLQQDVGAVQSDATNLGCPQQN